MFFNAAEDISIFHGGTAGVAAIGKPATGVTLAYGNLFGRSSLGTQVVGGSQFPASLSATFPAGNDETVAAGGFWFLDRTGSTPAVAANVAVGCRSAHNAFGNGIYVGRGVRNTYLSGMAVYGHPKDLLDRGLETVYRTTQK